LWERRLIPGRCADNRNSIGSVVQVCWGRRESAKRWGGSIRTSEPPARPIRRRRLRRRVLPARRLGRCCEASVVSAWSTGTPENWRGPSVPASVFWNPRPGETDPSLVRSRSRPPRRDSHPRLPSERLPLGKAGIPYRPIPSDRYRFYDSWFRWKRILLRHRRNCWQRIGWWKPQILPVAVGVACNTLSNIGLPSYDPVGFRSPTLQRIFPAWPCGCIRPLLLQGVCLARCIPRVSTRPKSRFGIAYYRTRKAGSSARPPREDIIVLPIWKHAPFPPWLFDLPKEDLPLWNVSSFSSGSRKQTRHRRLSKRTT
jgi:hypothetical protein